MPLRPSAPAPVNHSTAVAIEDADTDALAINTRVNVSFVSYHVIREDPDLRSFDALGRSFRALFGGKIPGKLLKIATDRSVTLAKFIERGCGDT